MGDVVDSLQCMYQNNEFHSLAVIGSIIALTGGYIGADIIISRANSDATGFFV